VTTWDELDTMPTGPAQQAIELSQTASSMCDPDAGVLILKAALKLAVVRKDYEDVRDEAHRWLKLRLRSNEQVRLAKALGGYDKIENPEVSWEGAIEASPKDFLDIAQEAAANTRRPKCCEHEMLVTRHNEQLVYCCTTCWTDQLI